jgi:hypothetical protein
MTSFKLEDNDCAIILKDNNEVEIILPKYEDDEEEVSENMLLAVGVVALIPTPEFQKLLSKYMTEVLDKVDEKKEKEEIE